MKIEEIVGIVREYFSLALLAVITLGIILILIYFIFYKTILKGKKRFSKKRLLLLVMFSGYVIMVIGVTFLNRGSTYNAGMDFSLFSSYRESWNSFSVRHWQFIYLNIFMFVPFGILFPLLQPRFRKAIWTIGVAALCTLSIESVQLITGYGNFVVDDLFNNLLGAIIGYGITMGFINIKEKGIKQSLFYFSPLLLVVILSTSVFTYYHLKEFGNLSIVATNKVNMKEVILTSDVEFNVKKATIPIYKAPSYTKAEADAFAETFYKRMDVDAADIEDISYPDQGIYRSSGEKSYDLWFQFLDGGYSFTDFSSHDEEIVPKDTDEESLKESLLKFGVDIQKDFYFQRVDTGSYEWIIDKKVSGNQLIDGSLTATYYNDHTVKQIENQLITYDKIKDIQIKSEQEAFAEILEGNFQILSENNRIDTLQVHKVRVSYYLDSKGYFQPVYAFQSTLDGSNMTILVPAI
ncbi:VanZ family protein [Sporosarcina siberiensis]|uniref:VanZ family protein n=1 Tax=Sporosarcina siberiensis TaxID=1365606 RepID=A0ABW4SFC9_9BACL